MMPCAGQESLTGSDIPIFHNHDLCRYGSYSYGRYSNGMPSYGHCSYRRYLYGGGGACHLKEHQKLELDFKNLLHVSVGGPFQASTGHIIVLVAGLPTDVENRHYLEALDMVY